jgi:thiosulfate/3-mercaptopyruvate sulfurtransferase
VSGVLSNSSAEAAQLELSTSSAEEAQQERTPKSVEGCSDSFEGIVLINAGELANLLEAGTTTTILDVRWRLGGPPGRQEFERGHVPGARFVDLERDLAAPAGSGGRHPLPTASEFGAAMRRLGVRSSIPVVVYDAGDSMSGARCWWMLRYFGHPRVSLLDGGLAAWTAEGRAIEAGPCLPPAVPGDFQATPGHLPLLDADGAAQLARTGVLLDARAGERYRGEVEPVDPVAGHIPGAVSAPTRENVTGDGLFLDAGALRERFAALGVTANQPVTVYCGSGITAAHEVLALEVAGYQAALYPGSWSHWITDPERPVATGQ